MANEKIAKYTLIDDYNRTTTRSYQTTGAIADVEGFAPTLDAVTDLGIVGCALVEHANIASPAAPSAGSSTDEAACVEVNVLDKNSVSKVHKVIIPSPIDGIFSGNEVDITNGTLLAWLALFAAGGSLRFADGSSYVSIIKGYRL
jgi:hypothetical protein